MGNQGQEKEYNIKFLGEINYQKKSYLIKRIKQEKYKGTKIISAEHFYKLIFKMKDKTIVFNLIDMNDMKTNSERGKYKADCIILEFDNNDNKSFEEIKLEWYDHVKYSNETDLIYLIGIKNDANKKKEDIKNKIETFSKLYKIKFFPLSDKENDKDGIKYILDELLYIFAHKKDTNNKDKIIEVDQKNSFKIVFEGESGIGAKTSLIHKILYPESGLNYEMLYNNDNSLNCQKIVELKSGRKITLDFFDTTGQELYRSLTKLFLPSSDCIVVGYSITDKNSFEEAIGYWYKTAKEFTNLIYLIGNKCDLYDMEQVRERDAINFAIDNNVRFFLTSCKDGTGVKSFLDDLVNTLTKDKTIINDKV